MHDRHQKPHELVIGGGRANTLPASRSKWPSPTLQAYSSLLAELDAWSRERGCSSSGNSWVAETAVREVWAETGVDAVGEPSRVAA